MCERNEQDSSFQFGCPGADRRRASARAGRASGRRRATLSVALGLAPVVVAAASAEAADISYSASTTGDTAWTAAAWSPSVPASVPGDVTRFTGGALGNYTLDVDVATGVLRSAAGGGGWTLLSNGTNTLTMNGTGLSAGTGSNSGLQDFGNAGVAAISNNNGNASAARVLQVGTSAAPMTINVATGLDIGIIANTGSGLNTAGTINNTSGSTKTLTFRQNSNAGSAGAPQMTIASSIGTAGNAAIAITNAGVGGNGTTRGIVTLSGVLGINVASLSQTSATSPVSVTNANNVYAGGTTVSAGLLSTGGTGSLGTGNVTVGSATLTLGNNTSLGNAAVLSLATGGTTPGTDASLVNLNFTGAADTLGGITNGSQSIPNGTYNAAARGFVVRTPGSTVTDLGTQFGVAIDPATEATAVQVFEGSVQAAPSSAATTQPALLTAGDAAVVTPAGVAVTPDGADPQAFVRTLSPAATPLELADLLSGGDGTTGRRGSGIFLSGPGEAFRTVPGLKVVDGVFVPNGSTRVDSAAHAFDFIATSGESNYRVWAGGRPAGRVRQDDPEYFSPRVSQVGDVDYAGAGHTLLYMNSNVGVTIDLAAVRRLHPGRLVSAFRCVVANNHPPGRERLVESFVLVDGVPRFQRRWRGTGEAPAAVDVPLAATDRFLTLAVTDGGDGNENGWDWILWGDPTLVGTGGAGQAGK